jgi:hypothetical protein
MFGKKKPISQSSSNLRGGESKMSGYNNNVGRVKASQSAQVDAERAKAKLDANRKRIQRPVDEPNQYAKDLIKVLPADLSMLHTYADYPLILNRIAASWDSPKLFFALMDELVIDQRGGRAGFPFEVLAELSRLAEHYDQFISRRPIHPAAVRPIY